MTIDPPTNIEVPTVWLEPQATALALVWIPAILGTAAGAVLGSLSSDDATLPRLVGAVLGMALGSQVGRIAYRLKTSAADAQGTARISADTIEVTTKDETVSFARSAIMGTRVVPRMRGSGATVRVDLGTSSLHLGPFESAHHAQELISKLARPQQSSLT